MLLAYYIKYICILQYFVCKLSQETENKFHYTNESFLITIVLYIAIYKLPVYNQLKCLLLLIL